MPEMTTMPASDSETAANASPDQVRKQLELLGAMYDALKKQEEYDECKHAFDDLECFYDDVSCHEDCADMIEEFHRRRRNRNLIMFYEDLMR